VESCSTQKSLWIQTKKIWNQADEGMEQGQQYNMTHHTSLGGSSPATPSLMQHHLLPLHPGASRHPYARQPYQPWEVVPNVEINNNQVGPLYPPLNQGAALAHQGPPLPHYQQLVYAHRLQQTPPYYSQMPVMRRQMDSRRNCPANQTLQDADDLAGGAPARGALKCAWNSSKASRRERWR